MDNQKEINVFISYAHDDSIYFDVFMDSFEINIKNLNSIKLQIWDDRSIFVGSLWDDEIQNNLGRSDLAILLVSDSFLASNYIKEKEFGKLFDKHKNTIIIPLLLAPCFFLNWDELSTIQFFKPKGDKYGMPLQVDFSFADLVKFRATDGKLIENVNIRRYIQDFIIEIEKTISGFKFKKEEKEPQQITTDRINAGKQINQFKEYKVTKEPEMDKIKYLQLTQIVNSVSITRSGMGHTDNRGQVFTELKIAMNNKIQDAFDFLEKLLVSDDKDLIHKSALLLIKMKPEPSIKTVRVVLNIIQTSTWLLFRQKGIIDITDSLIYNYRSWSKEIYSEIFDVLTYISTYDDQDFAKIDANTSLLKLNNEDSINHLSNYLTKSRKDDIVLHSLIGELVRTNEPLAKAAIIKVCSNENTDLIVLRHIAHYLGSYLYSYFQIDEESKNKIVTGLLRILKQGEVDSFNLSSVVAVSICLQPQSVLSILKVIIESRDLEKMKAVCLGIARPADNYIMDFWELLSLEENEIYRESLNNCARDVLEKSKLIENEEKQIFDKVFQKIQKQ